MENTKLHLLLLESEAEGISLIRSLLHYSEEFEYTLEAVSSAQMVEQKLRGIKFDLLIVNLAAIGAETSEGLISIAHLFDQLGTILVASKHSPRLSKEALHLGAQDFLHIRDLHATRLLKSIDFSIERFGFRKKLQRFTRELQKSRSFLLGASQVAEIGHWELDVETLRMSWSSELYNILGKDEATEEASYDAFLKSLQEDLKDAIREQFKNVLQTGKEQSLTYKIVLDDGTEKYVATHVNRITDKERNRQVLLGTTIDVTEQKSMERALYESEEKYKDLFKNSKDAIYITSTEGKFVECNEAAEEMFGYSLSELKEMDATELWAHPEEREKFRNAIADEGSVEDYELCIKRSSGEILQCIVTTSLWRDEVGDVIGYLGIIRNITNQKETEELIREKQVAERSAQLKQQFLANMSHEIRTPLNGIYGMANLLISTPLETRQKEFVELIRSSAAHLKELINDILDFSKIEAGKIDIELVEFDLRKIIKGVVETLKFKANEKRLYLKTNIDPNLPEIMLGDPVRLNQILINIVGNALKFTEEGGVDINIRFADGIDKHAVVKFDVIDTGIGISESGVSQIFESFTRETSQHKKAIEGTGLGLAITKQLVERQGGKIEVESTIGEGTTFTFSLKYQKSDKTSADLKAENGVSFDLIELDLRQILVAEDNKVNQMVLKGMLNRWFPEAEVTVVENGVDLIEAHRNKDFDIIISDIQMPEMGGIEATKLIRNEFNGNKQLIPILALTAFATAEEAEKCLSAGMNDFVPKPFEPKQLLTKLKKLMQDVPKKMENH